LVLRDPSALLPDGVPRRRQNATNNDIPYFTLGVRRNHMDGFG